MRDSKKKSDIIPFDIGRERYDNFKLAIQKQNTSVTENLIGYMDSVTFAEQKKGEGLHQSLPILTSKLRQTTLTEYIVNHINYLAGLPDEQIEAAVKTIPIDTKRFDHISNKLGIVQDAMFYMTHTK